MKKKIIAFIQLSFNIRKIFFYLPFILLIITSNTKYNLYTFNKSQSLAFTINAVYKISINKDKITSSIYIEGLINFFFKNKLLKYLQININNFPNKNNHMIYLHNIVINLKKSGFLNSIKSSITTNNNTKHCLVIFKTNPILLRVKIYSFNKLLLPKNLLIQLFSHQVGLPKNYINIYNSLLIIKNWYKIRGFKWLKVQLLYSKNTDIYIQINEGKIKSNKLFCKNSENRDINHQLNASIEKELHICPGNIVNIQKIELGIINLKENKLICNCNYKITRNRKNDIIVILKYSLHNDKIGYFFSENISLFKSIKSNGLDIIKSIFFIPLKNISDIILSLNQYLGFKYCVYNINNYNESYFLADIKNINNLLQLDIIYSYPYLDIHTNRINNLQINVFEKKYKIYKFIKIPSLQIDQYTHILQNHGAKIILKKKESHHIYYIKNISICNNVYYRRYLNIQKYNRFINKSASIQKNIVKIAQYKLINLQFYLKYKTIDINNKKNFGKLFIVDSHNFINLCQNILYNFKHSGQNLYLKYQENFIIPNIIQYIKKNAIAFSLESKISIFPINTIFLLIDNILPKYNLSFNSLNSFYSFNLEYQIMNTDFSILYLCINYKNSILNHRKFVIPLSQYLKKHNKKNQSFFAIGIQIDIPINTIPSLRLEYLINTKGEKFLQLKLFKI